MNSNWHEVSDDSITASQQELDTYWKIVSLKNAAALGLSSRRITAVDPRCDKDIVNEVLDMLSSPCWYQRVSNPNSGWTQISGDKSDKNNLLCVKGNTSVTFESAYNDEDDNMSYFSCRILYMYDSEYEREKKAKEIFKRYTWVNNVDFDSLENIVKTGSMADYDSRPDATKAITVMMNDGCGITIYDDNNGKCRLSRVIIVNGNAIDITEK